MAVARRVVLIRSRERRRCNFKFRQFRASCKALYCAAVEITRGKIQGGEVAPGTQQIVDQADTFEELRPIYVREQSHARNEVAYGYV